jgi:SM-20-related protein
MPDAVKLAEIYANNHGYGDHQHVHNDNDTGVTVLYYANAEWNDDWHGETVLYDRDREAHFVVAPRPGRLLMFPAWINHRGGTPSRTCFQRRVAVVFKFLGNEAKP